MCNPMIFMAVAAGVSAKQQMDQADQQKDMYNYQAQQAEADASASREQGQVNADKVRKAGRYQQSEARAALSASGVEVGAGTAVKIVQQIKENSEQDAQQQLLSGNRQAVNLNQDAALNRVAGSNAKRSGYMRAGGTLLEAGYGISNGWKSSAIATQAPAPVIDKSFSTGY